MPLLGFLWNSLLLYFVNQSNIHVKKVMEPRPAANILFNAWLSPKLCICLTAKFHLPLLVLLWDSLCSADLPYTWVSLQPYEHPFLLCAPPIAAGTQFLAGLHWWAPQGAVPPTLLTVTQFLLVQPSEEAWSWVSTFPSLLNMPTLKTALDCAE